MSSLTGYSATPEKPYYALSAAGTQRLARSGFFLSLLLYLLLPPPLLTVLHIPYDAIGGNFIFKLHVGTYCMLLTYLLLHCQRGNPLRSIARSLQRNRAQALYLGSGIFLVGYSIARYGPSGSAFIIDTLLMPVICVLALREFDDATQRKFLLFVITAVCLNALIGIAESIAHARLIPHTVAGGVVLKEDVFRSTALLGHPLNNALVTCAILLAALGLHIRPWLRAAMVLTLLLGLLSFGGRTAFFLSLLLVVIFFVAHGLRGLVSGHYSYAQIVGALVAALFMLGAFAGAVLLSGVGERIFAHLLWDDSAHVRLQIWRVFDYMSTDEIVFGLSPQQIDAVSYRLHLKRNFEAIENFWLLMLLQMGAIGLTIFLAGLFAALRDFWRGSSMPARLSMLLFFAVASSSNSLASKTSALSLLFVVWAGGVAYRRTLVARQT